VPLIEDPTGAAAAARPEPRAPTRTERAFSGWFWLSSGAAVQGGVTLGSVAVLARLLSPTDFGEVSVGMLAVNLVSIISQGLVGPALVQHPRLRPEHVETGFTLSLLGGIALLAVLWLAGPAVAVALHAPALVAVLRTLAWFMPIHALGAVADALLRRALQYDVLAKIRMTSYALGYGAVGVTVAALGGGLWALVAANLAQVSLSTALLLRRKPHTKRLRLHPGALRELLSFSGGHCLGTLGNYAATEGDFFVVVKWLGVTALGFYERAYKLMAMPAIFVGQVLDDVLFPAMAQIQTERELVAKAYRRCVAAVALFALPLTALVVVLAPEIVAVLLGPRWSEVVLPFRILAVGTLFRASYKLSDSLNRAIGAVYARAWREWAYATVVVAGSIVAQRWGLAGVAAAVLLALATNFLLTAHLGTRLVALSWADYCRAHAAGLRVAAVVAVPALVVATAARTVSGVAPALVLVVTVAAAGAVVMAFLLVRPAWLLGPDGHYLMRQTADFLRRRMRRAAASGVPGAI